MQFNFQQKYRFLYFSILIGLSCSGQGSDTVSYPSNYKAQKNVVYSKVGNWEGKLDVYYNNTTASPTPLVLNIHGGGWNHGSKDQQTGFGSFFKNGFSVANIDYRLAHQGNAPAAIEDVRCALLYLVQNAKQFHFDPNKIVLLGSSAGGHLALMAGLQEKNSNFDKNCYHQNEYKIAAIIDKYGITDLSVHEVLKSKSVQNWLGDTKLNLNFIASVSPVYYVTPDSPATFIVHGNADKVVPYSQSEVLFDLLRKMNVKTEFITVENGGHGKFPIEENKKVSAAMWKFLKEIGLY
jgi:acetyl esterase/lipase